MYPITYLYDSIIDIFMIINNHSLPLNFAFSLKIIEEIQTLMANAMYTHII